jgi:ribonuclease HI
LKSIIIHTDGAARGNPGPGGYGIILKYGDHRKEISEGFLLTTNNRMELLAVIVALENLKSDSIPVVLYSDSRYVVDAIEKKWLWEWEKKDFKNKKNADLWKRFIPLYKKFKIRFVWVKGHAGDRENERCDRLAVMASAGKDLQQDKGYQPV